MFWLCTLVKVVNSHGWLDIATPEDFAAASKDGQSEVEELHVGYQLEVSCEMGMLPRMRMKIYMHCRKCMVVIHETSKLMAQYV